MVTKIGPGASGAIRMFAFFVANGTLGRPILDGVDYWGAFAESPSQLERCFAIFANVLELDDEGSPTNADHAERRAATDLQ